MIIDDSLSLRTLWCCNLGHLISRAMFKYSFIATAHLLLDRLELSTLAEVVDVNEPTIDNILALDHPLGV